MLEVSELRACFSSFLSLSNVNIKNENESKKYTVSEKYKKKDFCEREYLITASDA